MKISLEGLITRLDSLCARINDLLDNLDSLEESEQEDIEIKEVKQHFKEDDIFNLVIATDVIEQADKLDKALEIIKNKRVNCLLLVLSQTYVEYNDMCENEKDKLTQEENQSQTKS